MKYPVKLIFIVILILSIFSPNIIFPVFSFIDFDYQSGKDTWLYVFFLSATAFTVFLIYFIKIIRDGAVNSDYYLLLIIFSITFLHILYGTILGKEIVNVDFVFFILSTAPAMCMAMLILHGHYSGFIISLKVYSWFVGICSLLFLLLPFFIEGESRLNSGGMNYQVWSYIGALIFGISTYELYVLKDRYFFHFWLFLIICSLLIVLIGAGRGAFLAVIVYTIKNVVFTSFKTTKVLIGRLCVILTLLLVSSMFYDSTAFIDKSLNRIFSYINPDGSIDLGEGSSGRSSVYEIAIEGFWKSPIVGYGPFYIAEDVILPHNILLSLLLQYGVFGLIILLVVLYQLFRNYIKYKDDPNWAYTFNIFMMPSVMLMVSGFYILNSLFMACLLLLLWHRKSPKVNF